MSVGQFAVDSRKSRSSSFESKPNHSKNRRHIEIFTFLPFYLFNFFNYFFLGSIPGTYSYLGNQG